MDKLFDKMSKYTLILLGGGMIGSGSYLIGQDYITNNISTFIEIIGVIIFGIAFLIMGLLKVA